MSAKRTLLICVGLALAAPAGVAFAQSAAPPRPGPNPGATATDAVTSPTKPTEVAPSRSGPGQVQHSAPPVVDPASAQPQGALTPAEVRELLDAAAATAKATREAVDYTRVMPDILTQILAKLDKLENKLDKIEDLLRETPRRR